MPTVGRLDGRVTGKSRMPSRGRPDGRATGKVGMASVGRLDGWVTGNSGMPTSGVAIVPLTMVKKDVGTSLGRAIARPVERASERPVGNCVGRVESLKAEERPVADRRSMTRNGCILAMFS